MSLGLAKDLVERLKTDSDFNKIFQESKSYTNSLDYEDTKKEIYSKLLNFYPEDYIAPYLPTYAKDCFIFDNEKVFIETGSYGMLGYGHNPDGLSEVLGKPQVMANVTTPSMAQYNFGKKLFSKIGLKNGCPYSKYLCLNSGSEGVALALRISDYRAKILASGRKIKYLAFSQGFHGRTYQPAMASDSSRKAYEQLASYDSERLITIPPNDQKALIDIYKKSKEENFFIEAFLIEPVMGEGNPGMALDPDFYKLARELTIENESLLIADSVQAGMRGRGVLSIVDYPGFDNLTEPDFEIFSKAISAGHFPLSVVMISKAAEKFYKYGLYGNTMTANPRALDIASFVLDKFTPEMTKNINEQGDYFKEQLHKLKQEFPNIITVVQGSGLLLSCELIPEIPVTGKNGLELILKNSGLNVIHGGKNALRFTPPFTIKKLYIDVIIEVIKRELIKYTNKI